MFKTGERVRGGRAYRQHTDLKNYLREKANYTCAICERYGDIIDHIIPYAISHDSSLSNLRVLCRECNLANRRRRYDFNPYDTLNKWGSYLEGELKK